jgi:transposase
MTIRIIGFDTAKHVFQVHGADASGKMILRKRLRRSQVADFFGSLSPCIVGMEATRGAHHWARVIGSFGHKVRLISPQFVKHYVKGQKNDAQDAGAICEAVSRPEMRFVPQKSVEQPVTRRLFQVNWPLAACGSQREKSVQSTVAGDQFTAALIEHHRDDIPESTH